MAKDSLKYTSKAASIVDTLGPKLKSGLMDLVGEDLYNIFEQGKIENKLPFGFVSKYDFRNENLNLKKRFGKNYQFDFDIKGGDDYRVKLTKDF